MNKIVRNNWLIQKICLNKKTLYWQESQHIYLMLWEPYPSHYNGLFSPLLVQRFRWHRDRSISVLSEQYETYYLFYITLSFLCNIICYLISVFVFSLVTLSGVTTYWQWGTWTKKGTLQQAKGVNRTTYWRRYIATTKWYPTTSY